MKSYNIKCKGCGIYLNDNPNSLGYVKNFNVEKTKYCKRCFDIKHYNKCITTTSYIDEINNTLDNLILDNYNIFIVLDVLDLKNSLIEKYKEYKNIYYIINKMDLLPKNHFRELTEENIIKNIELLGYQYESIIFCSTKSNSSIKNIDQIIKQSKNKNIFIGKSNVGKSSLIKKICELNKIKANVIVSNYLNTTNNLNKIKINRWTIIDTPGHINEKSILNYINLKDVKKIKYDNIKKPRNYQLFEPRTFKIENLVSLVFIPNKDSNVTFYTNDNLNILTSRFSEQKSVKLNNISNNINYIDNKKSIIEIIFNNLSNSKNNLVISGLCLISFKNIKEVRVYLKEDINVDILNYQII